MHSSFILLPSSTQIVPSLHNLAQLQLFNNPKERPITSSFIIIIAVDKFLVLVDTQMGLVITPPTNDTTTLVLVPLDVFLTSLDVQDVRRAPDTRHCGNSNDRVRRGIPGPDRGVFRMNGINRLARVRANCSLGSSAAALGDTVESRTTNGVSV